MKSLKQNATILLFLVLVIMSGCNQKAKSNYEKPVIDNTQSPHTKLRCIPMQDAKLTEGFWSERFNLAASKMLPALEDAMLNGGTANLNRIKFAAGLIEDKNYGTPWGDGDNYKWIETMAYVFNTNKDPELDKKMDYWIDIIGKAQEPDGYISTNIMHDKSKRFQKVNAHEMYNMGHLLTAACIHYRVTGKENFIDIAKKNADFLYDQWKAEPVHMARYPWNPSVFMGMAEMYRTTRNPKYLELLQIMIDNRGSRPNPDRDHSMGGTDQTQDRVPLRIDSIAVGHAVTGSYFYCGAADLYAETGDQTILKALERIWEDIHDRKIDIICAAAMGGQKVQLSPRGDEVHENFANAPYEQPNTYNETCSNIALGMFNYRMFMLTGDPKYAEWTERMMYNTLNSGVDLEGEHWFYCNPVTWDGTEGEKIRQTNGPDPQAMVPGHHSGVRWRVMNCYCCPPNVSRTIANIHDWFYNISDDGALWVNFYGGNQLSTTLADGTKIGLTEVTDYPWDGLVKIKIDEAGQKSVPIHFRIPGWTENPSVSVNNEKIDELPGPGNYLTIDREWKSGDEIILNFPMSIRLMEANPKVTNLNNKVAVMRGPVVYCLELPKQNGGEEIYKNGVFLTENISLVAEYRPDFLGGVTVIKGKALTGKEKESFVKKISEISKDQTANSWNTRELYRPMKTSLVNQPETIGSVDIELIPYYAWANRGLAYMDVWIPLAK